MKLTLANVPNLITLWAAQKAEYNPSFFMLLFLGAGSSADNFALDYVQAHALMLDNMSGPYASITVITEEVKAHGETSNYRPQSSPDMEYLHRSPSLDDDQGISVTAYTLAHKLAIPLDRFPALLVTPDPWDCHDATLFDLSVLFAALGPDASKQAKGDLMTRFFSAILTASREGADRAPSKRLAMLSKKGEATLPRVKGRFQSAIDSGIIAQVVEGLVKGLLPD